jgi:hypothetical protein
LGSLLHSSQSSDGLLCQVINFLVFALHLCQHLLFLGCLLLLLDEILAGCLLELEEAILIVLSGNLNVFLLLLPSLNLLLEGPDAGFLLCNLLGH